MTYYIFTSKGRIAIDAEMSRAGEQYIVCPICTSTRQSHHQHEKKCGINVTEMKWRCNHCQEGGILHTDKDIVDRVKPLMYAPNHKILNEGIYKWFKSRGISQATVDFFKIKSAYKKILQNNVADPNDPNKGKWAVRNCIAFPTIEKGRLINVQYRDKDKNFAMETGADKVCFNIDAINKPKLKRIAITEGHMDCMSYHEAGFHEVVSVPNGTTITIKEKEVFAATGRMVVEKSLNLAFLDPHIELFESAEEIIICSDDDAAGIKMREELARRFGKEKCRYAEYSRWKKRDGSPCKDSNDVLIHCGPKEALKTLDEALFYPMKSIVTIEEVWKKMENDFNNPIVKGLPLGFKELANHLSIHSGHTWAINGYAGSGKTSFIFYILVLMAVTYGWKSICYSPENYPVELVYDHLIEIYMGMSSKKSSPNRMSTTQYKGGKDFIKEHIFLISDEDAGVADDGYTVSKILKVFQNAIKRFGVRICCFDPWNSLDHQRERQYNIDDYTKAQLSKINRFTAKHDVLTIIGVHPPTPEKSANKTYQAPSMFDMEGGGAWSKKLYEIICVHRSNDDPEDTSVEIHIQKVKFHKLTGFPTPRSCPAILHFNRGSNRYTDPDGNDPLENAKKDKETQLEFEF